MFSSLSKTFAYPDDSPMVGLRKMFRQRRHAGTQKRLFTCGGIARIATLWCCNRPKVGGRFYYSVIIKLLLINILLDIIYFLLLSIHFIFIHVHNKYKQHNEIVKLSNHTRFHENTHHVKINFTAEFENILLS